MKQYIENLTNNLIGTHHFDTMWNSQFGEGGVALQRKLDFPIWIKKFLLEKEITKWTPGKLGEVMCSIDPGETGFDTFEELVEKVTFSKDCPAAFPLHLVAHYLATAISMRLWPESIPMDNTSVVKPYKMQPDSLLFQGYLHVKSRGMRCVIFVNGLGIETAFDKREAQRKLEEAGDPIWQEVLDNWPE